MRLVGAALPAEVHRGILGILVVTRRARRRILGLDALLTRAGVEQRPIHREVFMRQESMRLCHPQDFLQERVGDVPFDQSVAILAERRRDPDGIIRIEADEPSLACFKRSTNFSFCACSAHGKLK